MIEITEINRNIQIRLFLVVVFLRNFFKTYIITQPIYFFVILFHVPLKSLAFMRQALLLMR